MIGKFDVPMPGKFATSGGFPDGLSTRKWLDLWPAETSRTEPFLGTIVLSILVPSGA